MSDKVTRTRRARGDGGVYQKHRTVCDRPKDEKGRSTCKCVWWIVYVGPDGRRQRESSGSVNLGVAQTLVRKRIGAREHNLPVIRGVERVTFDDAAKAVIEEFRLNNLRSVRVAERRVNKHLLPYFGGRRLVGITTADVMKFKTHRLAQGIVAVKGPRKGERVADVSGAEVNRELQLLKRIFNLAIEQDRIASKPKIKMLPEAAARAGFFEREQIEAVLRHLPTEIQPVIRFAYVTGWRIASEVLPLQWRNVDFEAGEVRLDAGTTKNGEGRVFPLTAELRELLEAQHAEHLRLKKAGVILPSVFWRMVAKGRGGEKAPKSITSFGKAWKAACRAAGCPGKIPHDLRRTAVRNFVRAGISERVAMKLSGHKTPSVFQRYNITSGSDLKDASQRLDGSPSLARSAM